MDQDSSLNNSFDFSSQDGVMSLLASIRASNLNPTQKNELRDLVFLYTNGGGDVSVRIALEQKLIASNIKPVVKEKKVEETAPKPELAFGSYRPAPIFKTPAPVKVDLAAVIPAEPVKVVVPAVSEVVSTPPVAAPVAQMIPVPRPVPVPPVVTAPARPPVARPSVQVTKPVTTAIPPQVPRSVPVGPKVATNTSQATAPVSPSNSNYLDRIREIKSAVNSKVGNPVNLVDINNEVGREYMNALLEAMKRLSGGAAGQIDVAMERLETAYLAVELAVAEHSKSKVAEEVVVSAQEVRAVASGFEDVASVIEQVPVPAAQIPTQNEVYYRAPASTSVTEAEVPATAQSEVFANESNWTENTSAPIQPTEPQQSEPTSGFVAVQPTVIEPANISVSTPPASSLAQSARILTPQDLPAASSLASSYSGDPLHIREIDDGLEQLLSDWVLFNKSGLFGTGPKGREHPLFKKIADLQIPVLLSGRFEGSTQEIKQSITDYMNGWRYEQGIIYEQGETFEHYLRRVIKQILDLQNKRRAA